MHFGIVLACLAQDVDDRAYRVLGPFRPLHDTHHGLVARLALLQVLLRDEDVVGKRAVLREQVGIALLHLQGADEGLVAALQYFGDGSLAHVVLSAGQQRHLHRVAVHCVEAVALGHEDGFASFRRLEGVLAVCLTVENAGHHLHGDVQHVAVARLFLDEIVHEQAFQHVHEQHLGRSGVQVELLADRLQREGDSRVLLEEINDGTFQVNLSQPAAAGFLLSHNL